MQIAKFLMKLTKQQISVGVSRSSSSLLENPFAFMAIACVVA